MTIPWNAAEHAVIRQCVADKMPRLRIPDLFPYRTQSAVLAKIARMFPRYVGRVLREPVVTGPADAETMAERNREDDLKFQAAMLKAIKRGKEKAPIGIFKTPDGAEFRPRAFMPGIRSSGCSSSAALCAEVGDFKGGVW